MVHSKYRMNCKKNRDCTRYKKFGGYIGKNYFICRAEMWEDEPHSHDIYDRDVLKKGSCTMYVPKELDQDDNIHANDAVERQIQKNDQAVSRQE